MTDKNSKQGKEKDDTSFQIAVKNLDLANNALRKILPDITTIIPDTKNLVPSSVLEAIRSQQTSLKIIKEFNDSLNLISKMSQSYLASLDPLFNAFSSWNAILKTISESYKFADEEEFKKFEYNWVGFLTITEIKFLYKLWKEGNESAVKKYFFEFFSDENKIGLLLEKFQKNSLFNNRGVIIGDALNAHLAGKYTLSIPILLAQIDGIFIEKHKDLEEKLSKKCLVCKRKTYLTAGSISQYLANKSSEYLKEFLAHIDDTFSKFRNDILHGKKLDYADKDLSTKLIITLFELHCSTNGYG